MQSMTAKIATKGCPWGPPKNVDEINSGSHEDFPSISNDGLKLFFGSSRSGGIGRASDLWVSTRAQIGDDWGPPAHLGRLNGTYWNLEPELSADGTMLYYGRWDPEPGAELWQVPVLPLESVPLAGGGGEYAQTFDEALSTDGTQGQTLPTGWAVTNNGIVFENKTTDDFPLETGGIIPRRLVSAFNAGGDQEVDRSLAIAVAPSTDPVTIQFMTQVEESDGLSFQLEFDVEAWDSERSARDPGEAAFDVRLEIDSGDGFALLRDLGTFTTGNDLSRPTGDYLDGNLVGNRESFNSGVVPTRIPAGSRLRVLWEANTAAETRGWVFGLDNVSLNLFETGSFKSGDFNEDGLLDVADMDALTAEVLAGNHPTKYDLNDDSMVDEGDRTIWITDIKNTYFGDSNLDGVVNAADLNAVALNWRSEMATSWSQGDFNGDGSVSALDLNSLALNWRSGVAVAASGHTLPEPSCDALLLFGGLMLVRGARRSVG